MKAGFEHDVPLSKQAIALLHRVHVPNEPVCFSFPTPGRSSRPGHRGHVELLDSQIRAVAIVMGE